MIQLLYIDDSPINLHLVEKTLEGSNITLTGCSTSSEARELLSGRSFDIVAQDIIRPGDEMDGFALTHWLRKHCPNIPQRDIPVIIISVLDIKVLAEAQGIYRFDAFFDPAFIHDRLITTIAELVIKD